MESEKLTRCPYVDGDETQCDFESALARRRFYGPPSNH